VEKKEIGKGSGKRQGNMRKRNGRGRGAFGWNRGEGRQMEGKAKRRRPGGMRRKSLSPFKKRSI
jgi:hypothetical protein